MRHDHMSPLRAPVLPQPSSRPPGAVKLPTTREAVSREAAFAWAAAADCAAISVAAALTDRQGPVPGREVWPAQPNARRRELQDVCPTDARVSKRDCLRGLHGLPGWGAGVGEQGGLARKQDVVLLWNASDVRCSQTAKRCSQVASAKRAHRLQVAGTRVGERGWYGSEQCGLLSLMSTVKVCPLASIQARCFPGAALCAAAAPVTSGAGQAGILRCRAVGRDWILAM
jgi:hypothetical protein